jgi:hypothetical protein
MELLPDHNSDYGTLQYWEERYEAYCVVNE